MIITTARIGSAMASISPAWLMPEANGASAVVVVIDVVLVDVVLVVVVVSSTQSELFRVV